MDDINEALHEANGEIEDALAGTSIEFVSDALGSAFAFGVAIGHFSDMLDNASDTEKLAICSAIEAGTEAFHSGSHHLGGATQQTKEVPSDGRI